MLNIIMAVSEDGCIGVNDKLPWNIPEELRLFKKLTANSTLIMGRKTFESLPKKLTNREIVVLTKQIDYGDGSVFVSNNIHSDVEKARALGKPIFIAGGAEVYKLACQIDEEMALIKSTIKRRINDSNATLIDINDRDYFTRKLVFKNTVVDTPLFITNEYLILRSL